MLLVQAALIAVVGGILFSLIGIIPGTDETATMAPITLVLVLMGFEPVVIFSWFLAILVAMQITHTIPTAMAAHPGSTMAVPMVHNCNIAKRLGIPHVAMRKWLPDPSSDPSSPCPSQLSWRPFSPPEQCIFRLYRADFYHRRHSHRPYVQGQMGGGGRPDSIAFLIQGIQRISTEAVGKTLFISIFMGITIGPMIAELFNVLVPSRRESQRRAKPNEIGWRPIPRKRPLFSRIPSNISPERRSAMWPALRPSAPAPSPCRRWA
jgi:hypothetical protein